MRMLHQTFRKRGGVLRRLRVLFLAALWIVCLWGKTGMASVNNILTVCPSGCDHAKVRDALEAAVNGDTIQLLTTTPHSEIDIQVDKDVTIEGMGTYSTTLQAATLPYTAPGPVLTISPGHTVNIRDMIIRHGNATLGGGIYNDGSEVSLTGVQVRVNNATHGGGIYNASTGTVILEGSFVALNNAQSGGGIFNAGVLILRSSQITDNVNADRGGGIYNTGEATLEESGLNANAADMPGGSSQLGGGIYNEGSLTLIDSSLVDNWTGSTSSRVGGGIYSTGSLTVYHSSLEDNRAFRGAGLYVSGDTLITNSQITHNGAPGTTNAGGGIFAAAATGTITVLDSSVENNFATRGAGVVVLVSGGEVAIRDTTIHANTAELSGGGLVVFGSGLSLTNVTISGNSANENGGAIFVSYTGVVDLFNVTISGNTADADDDGAGNGGGLYLETLNNDSGVARIGNTLIANNLDFSDIPLIRAPDCYGEVFSMGYNLVRALGFSFGEPPCSIAGETTGNQIGVDPLLDVLADNGGPTMTHALLPGSPAQNAGDPDGCLDEDDQLLPADQRHALRNGRCDAGAFELGGLRPQAFLPLVIQH
jgi:predicted outer membrane repeat protein